MSVYELNPDKDLEVLWRSIGNPAGLSKYGITMLYLEMGGDKDAKTLESAVDKCLTKYSDAISVFEILFAEQRARNLDLVSILWPDEHNGNEPRYVEYLKSYFKGRKVGKFKTRSGECHPYQWHVDQLFVVHKAEGSKTVKKIDDVYALFEKFKRTLNDLVSCDQQLVTHSPLNSSPVSETNSKQSDSHYFGGITNSPDEISGDLNDWTEVVSRTGHNEGNAPENNDNNNNDESPTERNARSLWKTALKIRSFSVGKPPKDRSNSDSGTITISPPKKLGSHNIVP